MKNIKRNCEAITKHKLFELFIIATIILNSILIGIETYNGNETIKLIQQIILGIFTIEIILRFIAADNIKSFFKDGWNVLDLSLVLLSYIPENLIQDTSFIMSIRILRVFRVLRLLRTAKELKIIVTVLLRSFSAMCYNVILFVIFIYLYAIIGVGLFKLPNPDNLSGVEKNNYEVYIKSIPEANSPDPFGSLGEAMFTLFRELTGDAWTDIRYNQVKASEYNVIKVNSAIINIYHISWEILAAFLLLNLVTGAIINNYMTVIEENTDKKRREYEN